MNRAFDAEVSDMDYIPVTIGGSTFHVLKHFPRFRFMRTIQHDPVAALELVFDPDEWEVILDLPLSEEDFLAAVEEVTNVLAGSQKN